MAVTVSACSGTNLTRGVDAGAAIVAPGQGDAAAGDTRAAPDAAGDAGSRPDAAVDVRAPLDAGPARDAAPPDAGRRPPPPLPPPVLGDAGGDARPNVAVTLPAREIGPVTGSADTIAADDAGVYWMNHDNELWMLDETTGAAPQRLAQEPGPSIICSGYGRLAVAGDQLFWAAEWNTTGYVQHGTIHRTTKGGQDATLVSGVSYSEPLDLVVNGNDLYWNEGIGAGDQKPGTFVRTIPRDAAPGTSPQTLVSISDFDQVGSIAIIGPDLYWTTIYQGTTVPMPTLQRADLAALRQGAAPRPTFVASSAWLIRGDQGQLYVEQAPDMYRMAINQMPDTLGTSTRLALFDDGAYIVEIQFLDGWALASVETGGCGELRYALVAIPIRDVGAPIVHLAAGLLTPAVLGRELSFIDGGGLLHLVSIDDLRAALGAAGS